MGKYLAAIFGVHLIIGKQAPLIRRKHPLKINVFFFSATIDCGSIPVKGRFYKKYLLHPSLTSLGVVESKYAIKPLLNTLIIKIIFCLYSRSWLQPAKITLDEISRK